MNPQCTPESDPKQDPEVEINPWPDPLWIIVGIGLTVSVLVLGILVFTGGLW